jgi:hypothetical protein
MEFFSKPTGFRLDLFPSDRAGTRAIACEGHTNSLVRMKKSPLLILPLAPALCGLAEAQNFGQEDDITVLTVQRAALA